jgi:L-lactate dehydrogenase complex protein LldG
VVFGKPEEIMSSRDVILEAVRRNLPRPAVPLPEIPRSEWKRVKHGLGYKEHLTRLPEVPGFPDVGEPVLPYFRRQLEAMGGRSFEVADATAARAKLVELFPTARVICSAVSEIPGTRQVADVRDPHDLGDVDVGVVRSPLAVAEAGAVWLTQQELVVTALGVLSQHLIVLLDPAAVVHTMYDAYDFVNLTAGPYGVFLAGPSATGDIEGVIIHGAQGARSLTVLLLAPVAQQTSRVNS